MTTFLPCLTARAAFWGLFVASAASDVASGAPSVAPTAPRKPWAQKAPACAARGAGHHVLRSA